VTISHLVGERTEQEWVPPRTYTVPANPMVGYYDFYYTRYEVVHEPGYYKTHRIVRLETRIYDAATAKMVWAGQSDTFDPTSVADAIDSAADVIAGRIADDGLLR